MARKSYVFFYHFRKCDKRMSVHFRDQCYPCQDVICNVPCATKRNKRQPYLVMRGKATSIKRQADTIIIE
jgi:hypothetical protein